MIIEFNNEGDVYIPPDISEIEEIIKKGADILDLKNRPIEGFNEKKIFMGYLLLQQPAMSRSPTTVKDYFEIIEGQASWIVLRKFMPERRIINYENQERQREFINRLYEHSETFIFFKAREKALENLDSLGISLKEDYKLKQQEQSSDIACIV